MTNLAKRLTQLLTIAGFLLVGLPTSAVVVDTTGSYAVLGTNTPEPIPVEIVPLDLASKSLGPNDLLTVTEVITPDGGPNREWVEFIFSTPQGGPLANLFDELWQIDIFGIPTVAPSFIDGLIVYFTIDGVALDAIVPFAQLGFTATLPNPIPGAPVHDVWGGFFPPVGPIPSGNLDLFAFLDPYVALLGGTSESLTSINDFHIAARLSIAGVSEPSTFAILAVGLFGMVVTARRRRSRAAE